MKTVRIAVLAIAFSCCMLAVAAVTPVVAQCVPDPPIGTLQNRTCHEEAMRAAPSSEGLSIANVPLATFVRYPLISAATWMAVRFQTEAVQRSAVKPSHRRNAASRGGWRQETK